LIGEKSSAESEPLSPLLEGDMLKGGGERLSEEGGVAGPPSSGGGDEEYIGVEFRLPATFESEMLYGIKMYILVYIRRIVMTNINSLIQIICKF